MVSVSRLLPFCRIWDVVIKALAFGQHFAFIKVLVVVVRAAPGEFIRYF